MTEEQQAPRAPKPNFIALGVSVGAGVGVGSAISRGLENEAGWLGAMAIGAVLAGVVALAGTLILSKILPKPKQ